MNPTFVKPRYDAGGFASLPLAIASFLGGPKAPLALPQFHEQYDNVIFFFIDGFGWRHFEKFASAPFFRPFTQRGGVAQLTSQFPSTTSGHVTCIHTGLNVGQSGVFEWNYYEPQLDAMIVPLLFSFSGTANREQLKHVHADPHQLYPAQTIYQHLKKLGVQSHIFQHREYTPSTYSNHVFRGAQHIHGFKTLTEALTNLVTAHQESKGKNYFFVYYDKIDSISHDYGPQAPQVDAEIETFLYMMEKNFSTRISSRGRTLILLSADHGQAEVDPKTTIYLNRALPGFERFIRTNRQGHLLVPGGSCRDMFLYIKDEMLDEAQALLTQELAGRADVVRTTDLLEQGYFGNQISTQFLERVGNLVILAYRYENVWWYEKDKFEQKYRGHHGGLTPQEMEIPLLGLEI